MGKQPLKLHGKPFDIFPPSTVTSRVRAFLDKQKDDDLLLTADVLAALNISIHILNRYASRELKDYYELAHGRNRYWGNRRAVAELRRLKAEAECR